MWMDLTIIIQWSIQIFNIQTLDNVDNYIQLICYSCAINILDKCLNFFIMNNEQYSGVPMSSGQNTPPIPQMGIPSREKSKLPIIIVSIIVILCLIGGGVFAYNKFLTPTISPTEILKNSLQVSLNVRSLSFTATSTGEVENNMGNGVPSASNFTLTSNGSIDFHSLDTLLLDLNVGMNASVNAATSTGSLLLGVNAIYLNKNLYLDLKNFSVSYTSTDPKAAGTQMFVGLANGFASSLQNKWIQIDTSKAVKTSSDQTTLTQEDMTMIRDYIFGMSYVTAISSVGEEPINGTPTHHLKVTIQNGQELTDLIQKITLEKQTVTPKDMGAFNKRMADISKATNQKIDLDIWIGKTDSLVYKVVSSPVTISDTQTGTKTTTSQEAIFSNYNQPVAVTAPQGAVPLEQVMQSLFGNMFGGSTTLTPSKTTPIKKN